MMHVSVSLGVNRVRNPNAEYMVSLQPGCPENRLGPKGDAPMAKRRLVRRFACGAAAPRPRPLFRLDALPGG